MDELVTFDLRAIIVRAADMLHDAKTGGAWSQTYLLSAAERELRTLIAVLDGMADRND